MKLIILNRLQTKKNAKIITTEKDFVKIYSIDQKKINYVKVKTKFLNEKKFINYLKSKMYEKY